jgi:hypothetical protein
MLVGALLNGPRMLQLCYWIAGLNLLAAGFALAEYQLGVPYFYPRSSVTTIIYNSNDISGGLLRIPGTFVSAHALGGTMVATLPLLFGAWTQRSQSFRTRLLIVLGMVAGLAGILMSSTRTNFALAAVLMTAGVFSGNIGWGKRILWMSILAAVGLVAMTNDRFQRFRTLGDSGVVTERIGGSVNRGMLDIFLEYPMGNGLGGGGTSIPYFLQGDVRNPIGLESEFSRIMAEQGFIGLMIWLTFFAWFYTRRYAFQKNSWSQGRRICYYNMLMGLVGAAIGMGMLTAIPGSILGLLTVGWIATPMARDPEHHPGRERARPARKGVEPPDLWSRQLTYPEPR